MNALEAPEKIAEAFQAAWNAHDMSEFAHLFTADATFVNRFGRYVRGVEEIVAMHAPIHQTIYSDSTVENEMIDIKYLSETVAVVHLRSRLSAGEAHPAGPHQVDTVILTVLTKQEPGWLITALENVTLTDPRTGKDVLRPASADLKFELIKDAYNSLNSGDIDGFMQLFDKDIVRVEPDGFPSSGTYRGLEVVKEQTVRARATWAEGGCFPEEFMVAGENVVVAVHVRVRLKDQAEWIDARVADGFTFREDKAVFYRSFIDRQQALEWLRT